jgi:hypothetical protein
MATAAPRCLAEVYSTLPVQSVVAAVGSHAAQYAISEAYNARRPTGCELDLLGLGDAVACRSDKLQGVLKIE